MSTEVSNLAIQDIRIQMASGLRPLDIEDLADFVEFNFPHWQFEFDAEHIKLSHPRDVHFYIDPDLEYWSIQRHTSSNFLHRAATEVILGKGYCISFEDSYFLDYCIGLISQPSTPLVILHIDNHTDRGHMSAKFSKDHLLDNFSNLKIPVGLTIDYIDKLRGRGILHQGNFLSLFSMLSHPTIVIHLSNQHGAPFEGVFHHIEPVDMDLGYGLVGTQFPPSSQIVDFEGGLYWSSGTLDSLPSVVSYVNGLDGEFTVLGHVDLDEFDNPWDCSSENASNIPIETQSCINTIESVVLLLQKLRRLAGTHYCAPLGFFPSVHFNATIELIRRLHND